MAADRLVSYPYVVLRVSCANCQRAGRWRLARLAEKYGANIPLDELLARLVADCGAKNPRHPLHRECRARFTDLDPPMRPPDQPATIMKLVRGGKC